MSLMNERQAQEKNNHAFRVIVPAAGIGSRMQSEVPKQYLQVLGKPVIEHTLERLLSCERVAGVVVSISRHDQEWQKTAYAHHEKVATVHGGAERMYSVYNALNYLQREHAVQDDFVLVHDAARPCVSVQDIEKLMQYCMDKNTGAILASASVDTLKKVDASSRIESTLRREQVWRAQTPQMFRLSVLQQSIELMMRNNQVAGDEAEAIEQAGFPVYVVEGSEQNMKLTRPEDFPLIENILRLQA